MSTTAGRARIVRGVYKAFALVAVWLASCYFLSGDSTVAQAQAAPKDPPGIAPLPRTVSL